MASKGEHFNYLLVEFLLSNLSTICSVTNCSNSFIKVFLKRSTTISHFQVVKNNRRVKVLPEGRNKFVKQMTCFKRMAPFRTSCFLVLFAFAQSTFGWVRQKIRSKRLNSVIKFSNGCWKLNRRKIGSLPLSDVVHIPLWPSRCFKATDVKQPRYRISFLIWRGTKQARHNNSSYNSI